MHFAERRQLTWPYNMATMRQRGYLLELAPLFQSWFICFFDDRQRFPNLSFHTLERNARDYYWSLDLLRRVHSPANQWVALGPFQTLRQLYHYYRGTSVGMAYISNDQIYKHLAAALANGHMEVHKIYDPHQAYRAFAAAAAEAATTPADADDTPEAKPETLRVELADLGHSKAAKLQTEERSGQLQLAGTAPAQGSDGFGDEFGYSYEQLNINAKKPEVGCLSTAHMGGAPSLKPGSFPSVEAMAADMLGYDTIYHGEYVLSKGQEHRLDNGLPIDLMKAEFSDEYLPIFGYYRPGDESMYHYVVKTKVGDQSNLYLSVDGDTSRGIATESLETMNAFLAAETGSKELLKTTGGDLTKAGMIVNGEISLELNQQYSDVNDMLSELTTGHNNKYEHVATFGWKHKK